MTHVIIPAAGFGKRVGTPKSKELLYYKDDSFPLIQWCLNLCKKYELKPIVISRKDKIDLNEFLVSRNIETCLIDKSEEWTHSVELSQDYWGPKNILILPDSRFKPEDILLQIQTRLSYSNLVFGVFDIAQPQEWGVLSKKDERYLISEKPRTVQSYDSSVAWGIIGFQKEAGAKLFSSLRKSSKDHLFYPIESQGVECFRLHSYEDVTRSRDNLYLQPKS